MNKKKSKSNEEEYFLFYKYKNDLLRLTEKFNCVVEDTADFWKFVQKYEDIERKKQITSTVRKDKIKNVG